MRTLALIAVLAGCSTQADDDYPIRPGGGLSPPVVTGGGTGGGTGSGTDSDMMSGRVCVVADARDLSACSTSAASGLAVTSGSLATTTAADGSFSLAAPASGDAMVGVSGPDVVPTQMRLAPAGSIPVLAADLFSQMMAANGITPSGGSGSILATVARGGMPVTGVTVTSTPSPAFGPLFDGSTPTSWTLDGTGTRGVVWVPGVAAGPTQLTFRDLATSGETTVDGVQVVNGGITIMDAVLP